MKTNQKELFIAEEKKNYGAKYKLNNQNTIKCYSKNQLRILYPEKDYKIVAEYAHSSQDGTAGFLEHKNKRLKLSKFKSNNRTVYRERGYLSVGEDNYVVLLENAVFYRAAALVLCLAVIASGIVLAINLTGNAQTVSVDDESIAAGYMGQETLPELEEGAVDWEGAKPRETGGVTAGIAIPGYKSITIDAEKTDVKVNLQNPTGNPCYFVISLVLDDGTELYKSKMIEPGKGLYDISISKALAKGEYPAIVKYETFSLEGLNPLNGAEVKITLIAQ